MADSENKEPISHVSLGEHQLTILGTAHVSRTSAEKVEELLAGGDFDAVAVELCPSRYNALVDPESLARMDLFKVLREGKVPMVTASLALGAYQQRMAEQFGIEPGAEMRTAVEMAKAAHLPILLIDREVGITLKRIYREVRWWRRLSLVGGLIASVVSREKVSEEEIERLKEGDMLESAFSQFAEQAQDLFQPLIAERDRYMAARLRTDIAAGGYRHTLVVVGAGHLRGIEASLSEAAGIPPEAVVAELDTAPEASRWPKAIPWVIVALVFAGFALGFARSGALGWSLVLDWVLINGGLSALGALVAGAHPLTVLTAFVAAPITSLNPTIGAGMVTATVEVFLRRPRVGDFGSLRHDTAHLKGWWGNRVARTLLIFLLSTFGSAVGTYVAGFRIFERLTGS